MMNQPIGPDASTPEPPSDPCSECGRPVARVPLLYDGKDDADRAASKAICFSCLKKARQRKRAWSSLGGLSWWLNFGEPIFWVGWLIAAGLASLIALILKR